jgi:hypothetical protein
MLNKTKKSLLGGIITMTLVAAGCGGGGGGDGGGGDTGGDRGGSPGNPPPLTSIPAPSASFADGGNTFSAGRVVSLDVENFALTDELEVTLGGAAIPAQVVDGRVVFVIPVEISGAQTIVLSNSARSLDVPVTVEALAAPANPTAYVSNVQDRLAAILEDLIADASGDELTMLEWAKTQLEEQRDILSELDAEAIKQMAALLKANGIDELLATASNENASSFTGQQKADLARCNQLSDQYPTVFASAILSTGIVVAGLFPPSPLALVGLAAMTITVKKAQGVVGQIVDACLNPFGEPLLREIGGASSANGPQFAQKIQLGLPFNHNQARTFEVEVEARLLDVIGDNLTTLAHRLGGMIRFARQSSSAFAAGVPASIEQSLLGVSRDQFIPAEANTYSLTDISDSRITGTANASGSRLTLKFAYREGQVPASATNFEFALTDVTTNKVAGTYGATLNKLGVPTAYGASIDVQYGETFTGRLSSSFGDRYEIVSQPAHGTVGLTHATDGTFTYYTTSQAATDAFTYRAVNDAGPSQPATVEVRVNLTPLYEAAAVGTWNVYYAADGHIYNYTMVLNADGSGYYDVDDTQYRIEWYIARDSEGYKLYENGFWHYAFDGMARTPLTLPITSFTRRASADDAGAVYTKL